MGNASYHLNVAAVFRPILFTFFWLSLQMVLGYGVLRLYFSSPRLVTTQTWTGQSQVRGRLKRSQR